MAKFMNPTKVITGPNTTFSYLNCWEPRSINGSTPKYSVSLIIPKSDKGTIDKINAAIQAAYEEGQSTLKGSGKSVPALSMIKTPLRDGDTERPDDEAYANSYFINANSSTAPGIVDADRNPNQKHLTLSNRTYIEQELLQKSTFSSIGEVLHKDPSTISKEVKRYSKIVPAKYSYKCNLCKHYKDCDLMSKELKCPRYSSHCSFYCKKCYRRTVIDYCPYFLPYKCDKINKPPYVCNYCEDYKSCPLDKKIYDAAYAQRQYEKNLYTSRKGINMTPEELQELNDLISPLILKGQPLSHIFAVHADEIPVCRRTLYNYLDQRVFQARNIDLPRRVRYKKRKKKSEPRKSKNLQQVYRNKRTYVDFERFMEAHPDLDVVEMDTVKGGRDKGKCLLTLLFRSCSFMIVILMPDCTQRSVIKAINDLTEVLGIRTFKKYFPVILTDNGSEFKNPWDIEKTESGTHRTYVFYCDPYVSNQKGRLEKNHEYIRYVIPKGRSMYRYTQDDINLMTSHINSTARDSLNGATPFDLAALLLDKKIPALAGQFKVSPDEVMLKPALIEMSVKEREANHE